MPGKSLFGSIKKYPRVKITDDARSFSIFISIRKKKKNKMLNALNQHDIVNQLYVNIKIYIY